MSDERFMRQALQVANRALGNTGSNPAVGCVLVHGGVVIATGATGEGGRPHAEVNALTMAGEAAQGATAYVTLEPCSHHGKTPPCAEALVKLGVVRVVVAQPDPDARVSGRGIKTLREAGIEVLEGVLADEAGQQLRAYLMHRLKKRAYVTLKLAVSADGKITAERGMPTAITGEQVRARVHLMRARCDAIMVGVSTVLADNPSLTCRLPGMAALSPVRIVSDSRLSIPLDCKMVQTAPDVPVWIMTTENADQAKAQQLESAGVRIITCNATPDGKVDLDHMLTRLAEEGILHVFAEGGAHMARALVEADLVDDVELFNSPDKIGEQGLPALAGLPLDTIRASKAFRQRVEPEKLGRDWLISYARADR